MENFQFGCHSIFDSLTFLSLQPLQSNTEDGILKKKPKANSIFYKTRQSEAANHSEFIMATKGSGCQRQYGVLSVGLYRSQNYTVFP